MSPFESTHPIRVAFYIRVSTEEQAKDGYGADMQLRGLQDMIKYKAEYFNWTHDTRYEYFDMGCTGADLNRPQYKKMMEDAKKGKFDIVAVWKIDRLSRNLSHLLGTFEILQNYKVGFYSLKENVDFSGPIGKLTFQIFGALAEFERETIKTRTKEGKVSSARLGNYILSGVPFGYNKAKTEARTNRTLTVNEPEAEWVKKLFSTFIAGESLEGLARMMNEHQVPKSKTSVRKVWNTKWHPQSIKTDILENTTYIGRAYYNSKQDDGSILPIEIKVPRIVSDLDFEVVRMRLTSTAFGYKRGGGGREGGRDYLLSRKVVDMETGRKFIGVHRTKGGHSYRRKQIVLNGITYKNREIPGERIDEHVWAVVEEALNRPEKLFKVYTEQSLDGRDYERYSAERDILGKKFGEEEQIEIQYEEEYHRGEYSEDKRNALVSRCVAKQATLKKEITKLDGYIDDIVKAQSTKEALEGFTRNLQTKIENLSSEQKQYLVDLLVEQIEVTWTKSHPVVQIILRFDQTDDTTGSTKVEPKKSFDKPKVANRSSQIQTMVDPPGIEPGTNGLGVNCSNPGAMGPIIRNSGFKN